MKVNYEEKTIVITKAESKSASKIGSATFNQIVGLKAQFSDFAIVVEKAARKRDTFKGLTYDYMLSYIKAHEANREENIDCFIKLRGFKSEEEMMSGVRSEFVDEAKYAEIKSWFLNTYPEVVKFNDEVSKMREAIKSTRKAA